MNVGFFRKIVIGFVIAIASAGVFATFSLRNGLMADNPPVSEERQVKASELADKAFAKAKERNYAAAIAEFTEAIELDPNLAKAYIFRAHSNYLAGNKQEAVADFEESARIFAREGDQQKAQAMRKQARFYQDSIDAEQ